MGTACVDMVMSLDGFVAGPNAGLVDELQIHMVSKLLGSGLRLFEHGVPMTLERTRVLESPGVTHLRFRVVK